jgi:tRNA uridine 5-carboxymethylaminomethyl modification enzyme
MEDESLLLDPSMEYSEVPGLSSEVVEKLYRVKPTTIVSNAFLFFCLRK